MWYNKGGTVLSIIIPVYNTREYLDRCVRSVTKQLTDETEIILVDDGSTDGSGVLCDIYAKNDKRIKVVHKENGGLASARNAGLDVAKGEYVNFLDSDDWLNDGAVACVLSVIKEYSPDMIGYGFAKTTGVKDLYYRKQPFTEGLHTGDEVRADLICPKRLFTFETIRSSCTHVFKRSMLKKYKIRFVSERIVINEDYLFIANCGCHIESYYWCDEIFYNYYTRENSLTTAYRQDMYGRKRNLIEDLNEITKDGSAEVKYRTKLFALDCCYESLNNECRRHMKTYLMKEILDDVSMLDPDSFVRKEEQTKKALFFLKVMSVKNVYVYRAAYGLLKMVKKIRGIK